MNIAVKTPPIDTEMLARLADVTVRVGLNLQPGQDLVISASTEALPMVRLVAAAAYRAGAGVVTPLLSDEAVTLARFENALDASFDSAAGWLSQGMAAAFENNAARLAISSDNPMLLAGQDPEKVARASKAGALAGKIASRYISEFKVNWCVAAYPTLAWARQVFPEASDDAAVMQLANAIFAASRVNNADPVAAWETHTADLRRRTDWLNAQRFDALHFTGPGTDLTIGLADDHCWQGGAASARNGITCQPNIPTEEVFTTPHAARVEGRVRASKPLVHQGSLIEGIEVRFEAGRIVEATATKGQDVFRKLLESDEGAARLGEVALVPHNSPISQSGLLFYNTLFDENAACHIALGQCYADCFTKRDLSAEEVAARGGNTSIIHVDWMIGSAETDIDGITASGARVPVFRAGNWA